VSKPISQREARQLRKRVRELEARDAALRKSFGYEYPGAHLGSIDVHASTTMLLETAARCGHVVIARRQYGQDRMNFYAIPTEAKPNV